MELQECDLSDLSQVIKTISLHRPAEVYNLAAMSFVPTSWKQPVLTGEFTGIGVTRVLEAIRLLDPKGIKFYQASSSEMFGAAEEVPQHELTRFHPRSPYGVAKVFAHHITVNYRESYGLFACNGILFNHEGPRRGPEFVTRKITQAVARIKFGRQERLTLGNLESKRDWGYAKDYVEAMWMMLQLPEPVDLVFSTGQQHSVRECVGADKGKRRVHHGFPFPREIRKVHQNGEDQRARRSENLSHNGVEKIFVLPW